MIPKELQERIQQEAKETYDKMRFYIGETLWKKAYIDAATTYVERWQRANQFIRDLAKEFGEDDLGRDGKEWSIEDFVNAAKIKQFQQAKDALDKIKSHPYPYMDPTDFGQMCDYIEAVRGMANQVLNSWKEEGNQEQNKTT